MKYIAYSKFCPEDMEKVVKKFGEYKKEHEENPGKYQEYLFPPHFTGQTKGFSIVEGTPEQINNVLIFWTPLIKFKYIPIRKAAKYFEQYMKSK